MAHWDCGIGWRAARWAAAAMVLAGLGCVTNGAGGAVETHVSEPQAHARIAAALDYVCWARETPPAWLEGEDAFAALEAAKAMRTRHDEVAALKAEGCLGENARGYLELRPQRRLEDPEEKNAVQRLLAAENADRRTLYRETARASGTLHLSVSAVERRFAAAWLRMGQPGALFELPKSGEAFDAFVQSEAGRALGPLCKPGAWVALP